MDIANTKKLFTNFKSFTTNIPNREGASHVR